MNNSYWKQKLLSFFPEQGSIELSSSFSLDYGALYWDIFSKLGTRRYQLFTNDEFGITFNGDA